MLAMTDLPPGPRLSVVAPAHNEEDNVARLIDEVAAALGPVGRPFEFIIVDDGSTDGTRRAVQSLMAGRPWLRCLAMAQTPPGRGHGQSAAFYAGFRACRGEWVATLDADCQNDPADLPRMLELLERTGADMVQGDRSANRRDSAVRRAGSVVGRTFRRWLLGDTIRDTGCSLRVMRREIALRLPLELRGMHRFIPATARQMGYKVVEMPVSHRPRTAGETKYGMGIASRAIPGLVDCFAVRYMGARRRPVLCEVIEPAETEGQRGADAATEAAVAAPKAVEVGSAARQRAEPGVAPRRSAGQPR